ncbi:MAG: hypothetical protein K2X50_03305 [Gammaproteobacteria bacterium]|nr:hypothetical protein [Gammaproteobacteria bacterium]
MRRRFFQSAMDNGEFGDKLTKQQAQQPDNQRNHNPANLEKALEQKQLDLESAFNTVYPNHIPGLQYQQIPGDRPCLFTVLAFCLNQSVEFLRTEVATHIEDNMEVYRDSINPNKTPEQHLVGLRNGLEWANNLEIMALMRIFEQPIIVIGPDGRIGNELDRPDLLGLLCFCDPIFVQYNDQNYFGALILDGTKEAKKIINDLIQSSGLSLDISMLPLDLEPINKEEACEDKKIDPPPHLDQEPLNTEIKGDALNIKKSDIQFCIGTIQKFKFDLVIVIRRAETLLRSIQNELLNDSQVFNIVKCFIDHSVNERHPAAKAYFNILRLIRNVRTKNGVVSDEAALITLAKWLNLLNDANDLDEEIFKQIITYRNPNEIFVDLSSAIKELQAEQQAQKEEAIKLETNAQLPRREPMLRRIKEPEPDQEQTQQPAHQIKQEPAKKEPTNPHKNDDGSWRSFPTEDADRVQYSIDTIAKQIPKINEHYLPHHPRESLLSVYKASFWTHLLYKFGPDITELHYLWTAAMLFGIRPETEFLIATNSTSRKIYGQFKKVFLFKTSPESEFTEGSSVRSKIVRAFENAFIKSPCDESYEMDSFKRFTKNSLYETKFKQHLQEGWLLKKQQEIAHEIWKERISYINAKIDSLIELKKSFWSQREKMRLGKLARSQGKWCDVSHPEEYPKLERLGVAVSTCIETILLAINEYRVSIVSIIDKTKYDTFRNKYFFHGIYVALSKLEESHELQGLFPSEEDLKANENNQQKSSLKDLLETKAQTEQEKEEIKKEKEYEDFLDLFGWNSKLSATEKKKCIDQFNLEYQSQFEGKRQTKQQAQQKEPTNPHKNDDGSWRSFPTEDADRVQYSIDVISKYILDNSLRLARASCGWLLQGIRCLPLYSISSSSDPIEIRYLWTAAILFNFHPSMIICEANESSLSSNMFRLIRKSVYDQSDQIDQYMSSKSGQICFTAASLYSTKFKHHLSMSSIGGKQLREPVEIHIKQYEIADVIWKRRLMYLKTLQDEYKSKKDSYESASEDHWNTEHPSEYVENRLAETSKDYDHARDSLNSTYNTFTRMKKSMGFKINNTDLAKEWYKGVKYLEPIIRDLRANERVYNTMLNEAAAREREAKKEKDKADYIIKTKEKLHSLFRRIESPTAREINAMLANGADINYQNDLGETPLMLSVDGQHDRIVEYLLKLGADPLIRNKKGELASDLASKSSPIYTLLKEKEKELEGAKLPAAERYGQLLLEHIVTLDANARQIEEYLDLGADVNYQDSKGISALMLAVDKQNERLAEFLLKCNADPLLKNNRGNTARDLASSNTGIYAILKGYEFIFATAAVDLTTLRSLLVGDKALIDFRSHQGHTALLIAVECRCYALVEFLIAQDADLSIPRADGRGVFDLVNDNDDEIHQLLSLAKRSREAEENASPRTSQSNPSNNMFSFFEGTDGIPEDEESILDETLQDDRTYSGPND